MNLQITAKSLFCSSVFSEFRDSSTLCRIKYFPFPSTSLGQRCVLPLEIPQRKMMTLLSELFLP